MAIEMQSVINGFLEGSIRTAGREPVINELIVSENGTYTPPSDIDGYNPVIVNVPIPTLDEITITSNGTYTPATELEGYNKINVNVPLPDNGYILNTGSGAYVSYNNGVVLNLQNLEVNIKPIQSGSGDPSPTNVRPISGWDAVNVGVASKNLVNWKWNAFNDGKMEIFLKGGTYTLSAESTLTNGNAYIRGTKPSGEYVSREELGLIDWSASSTRGVYYGGGGQQTYTFNVPNGGAKIEFGKLNNNGTINAQLEIGDTATTYEPYNGQTYTIDLDGTRYGGTLDVVSGELKVVPYYASYNGETLDGEWISDRDVYAVGSTPTIGAQVVNIGATPQTYQLTPTQVKSLLGINNVWADTGSINNIEYFAK